MTRSIKKKKYVRGLCIAVCYIALCKVLWWTALCKVWWTALCKAVWWVPLYKAGWVLSILTASQSRSETTATRKPQYFISSIYTLAFHKELIVFWGCFGINICMARDCFVVSCVVVVVLGGCFFRVRGYGVLYISMWFARVVTHCRLLNYIKDLFFCFC